jgi:hypothetical protein
VGGGHLFFKADRQGFFGEFLFHGFCFDLRQSTYNKARILAQRRYPKPPAYAAIPFGWSGKFC